VGGVEVVARRRCCGGGSWNRGDFVTPDQGKTMAKEWKLRKGKTLVVEDAQTASLVIVARDLEDQADKAAELRRILRRLEA
jgi:Holliday junction resolvase